MCLITNQKEPFIAEEDIIVYKEMNNDSSITASAIFYPFVYELGKLYQTTIQQVPEGDEVLTFDGEDRDMICKSLNLATYNDDLEDRIEDGTLICFGDGFHSFKDKYRVKPSIYYITRCIYQCTIPKGSEYYVNPSGLVVSNQIIINKILE